MDPSRSVPASEMERMMKLQDVILKAMAKKISWMEAAEIAGMSVRNMQRKRADYQAYGYTGLFDQRRASAVFMTTAGPWSTQHHRVVDKRGLLEQAEAPPDNARQRLCIAND